MTKEERIKSIERDLGKLTEEERESVLRFSRILKECEGLPVEEKQKIIDGIQDKKILEFLKSEQGAII